MAYEDYMDYAVETEEQRRKREEEERLRREAEYGAAQDAVDASMGAAMTANAAAPASGGFMGAVGNYAQRRFDQAVQPFTDPAAALNRRLGMTPEDAANTEVQSTQVKTYGDGSQEEIVKRQIPAATSAPVNPADMGAVPQMQAQPQAQAQQKSPEEIAKNAQALREMAQGRMPAPAAAPAPAAPAAAMPQAQMQQPAPESVVAPVAPSAMPVATAPTPAVTPTGQPVVSAPQTSGSLSQAGAQAQATPVAPTPTDLKILNETETAALMQNVNPAFVNTLAPVEKAEPAWMTAANEAGTDFDKLVDVASKFPESRTAIKEKLREIDRKQQLADEAKKDVELAAKGDIKAQNRVNQALRPEKGRAKEEVTANDYIKAYMYARLGLNDLASEVQKKIIGKDTKFGQVTMPDGSNWDVEKDSSGRIVAAKDNEGTVATESILSKIRADSRAVTTATPPSAGAVRIRDSEGTEFSVVPTPRGSTFYNNKGEQGVPVGRTVPIAVGSDLEIAQARQDIETVAKFGNMTAQARLDAWSNTNKLRADKGLNGKTLEEMGLNPDGSLIGEAVRRTGTPPAAPVPQAPAPVQQTPAPVQQTPVAPTPVPTAPAARPAAVNQPAAAPTPSGVQIPTPSAGATKTAGGAGQTASQMMEQTKEDDLNRTLREAAAKAKINVAQNLEEQKNKVRTAMPASEGNVVRILTTLNDIATHPGLDKTVGLPRILATPLEMIPGGDQRAFAQKFKQLGGQEFLAAYNELRGGGGISETEGAKAEQAISALKDTGISPAAFKQNMWILQDAVKTGFDRQRELVGQTPKYRESPDREGAKEWLRNNPNHPKAAGVRKKLVGY